MSNVMMFYSTNRKAQEVTFREALFRGQPEDGGLYMPEQFPPITLTDLETWQHLSYHELATELSLRWVGDEFDHSDLREACQRAYDWDVPLREVEKDLYVLELWHGPTLAFKDFAARWLGEMVGLARQTGELTVLVATSGDTGGAVVAGFYNVPGVRVIVLYPSGKVTPLQEKQLTTFGKNITAVEVDGSFDDCQALVKQAFADIELRKRVNMMPANSINIGRVIPQTFYYVWAYLQAVDQVGVDEMSIAVPSGNFGNVTAAAFAKRMGLLVQQLIVATNANSVFTEFLESGRYQPRPSVVTLSNAMDIGDPSNVRRLFDMYSTDSAAPADPMHVYPHTNIFNAPVGVGVDIERFRNDFWSTSVDDQTTRKAIKEVYEHNGYVIDPHTAVAFEAVKRYRTQLPVPSDAPIILASTAHPAKFIEIMEEVLGSGVVEIPSQLRAIMDKKKESILIGAEYGLLKEVLLR